MKRLLPIIAVLLAAIACRERPVPERDTIPYVKQLASDSTGVFGLVRDYRTAGTRGSIALIGEPDDCLLLAAEFLSADNADNIDGKPSQDRLPDFAGESFDVLMDAFNAPYLRMAAASPDSLREVAVRCTVMALDTVSCVNAYDKETHLHKNKAKVIVLASSLLTEHGLFDVDTLFKMAGREPLILSPVESMLGEAVRSGLKHVAVWAPAEAKGAYLSAATGMEPGLNVTVLSPGGGDVRSAFRELLRQYRNVKPNAPLEAVLVDSFSADEEELDAELTHIRRQITEEDLSFDRILVPGFRFIEPKSSLTSACYRLLRERNLFTHDIAYPSARFYQTEEGMDGECLLVEVSPEYIDIQRRAREHRNVSEEDLIYVPDRN